VPSVARIVAVAAAILLATSPLGAQERTLIVSLYGGGAGPLAELRPDPPTWFMPGYSLGASLGVQLTRVLAVRGDFTYTRNPVEGAPPLAGRDVNRFFYGVHAVFRFPKGRGIAPFVFAGAGGVSIDQLGVDAFSPTTRPAVMYGGGVFYTVPRSRLDVFGEIKGLTYNWNMAGFHRNMVDVTFTAGVTYRIPL
jgi:hypothetical protein